MKAETNKSLSKTSIPLMLEQSQHERLEEFAGRTGLSRSFIIRRCVKYCLGRFVDGEVDILTLKKKQKIKERNNRGSTAAK
ncbi:MAG: hypothetical protein LBH01_01920 [Verrucomicrobiales bacterium]|jgi:hypothetical protein|nr:hypothetical protein [Verrucomicrobiales bacterium]